MKEKEVLQLRADALPSSQGRQYQGSYEHANQLSLN